MNQIHHFPKVARWLPTVLVLIIALGRGAYAQDVAAFQADAQANFPCNVQADFLSEVQTDRWFGVQAGFLPDVQVNFVGDAPVQRLPDVQAASPAEVQAAFRTDVQANFLLDIQAGSGANIQVASQTDAPASVPADSQPSGPAAANPSNPEHIGQAPQNNAQQFLREDTILLKPGQWQVDAGLSYLIDEKPFTQLSLTQPGNVITPVNSLLHRRLLVADFTFRYGYSDRLQFFADLPVGWTNTEIASLGCDHYTNDGGLGDTSFGASYLLHKSCGSSCDPDIIATAGVTAPTSHVDFLNDLLVTPQATLGQGFWALYWNILFVQTYDPVILFYGLGSRHTFTREEDGFDVQAGDQYIYRCGRLGLAVNERVTFSSSLFGAYITEPRINGQIVPGTSMEPVYLRCAVTLAEHERICEPFVEFGLTYDAANTRFGVVWTY